MAAKPAIGKQKAAQAPGREAVFLQQLMVLDYKPLSQVSGLGLVDQKDHHFAIHHFW